LQHRWVVYSETTLDATFSGAVGCDAMNGLEDLPDLKAFRVLDPTGAQQTC
jgi:hypothetical protein